MSNQNNFLNNYFKINNPLLERITIKKKIFIRLICFIICSILYPLFTLSKRYNKIYGGDISSSNIIMYIEIIMIICYVISALGLIWIILSFIIPDKINELSKNLSYSFKKTLFNILDWGMILPICSTIAIFFYTFIFIITPISGTSMNPTIQHGDNILVSYLDNIDRFDVVVLEVNENDNFNVRGSSYYIKRIIGMPGDTVSWINKTLTINGEIVEESFYDNNYLDSIGNNYDDFNGIFKYKDNNEDYQNVLVIPDGYYFVMGDN